jgi:hypothetical protein
MVMAADPTIQAFNRTKYRLGQLVPEVSAVVSALRKDADALAVADPMILERCEGILSELAAVVAGVDRTLEQLWQRQPPPRLLYHIIHQQQIAERDR